MRIIPVFILCFLSLYASGQNRDRPERDSLYYLMPELAFDSAASTNRYIHPSGLSMRYPPNWSRDNRGSYEELMIFIRKAAADKPYAFREMFTLNSDKSIDSTLSLADFVATQEAMSISTWQQYEIEYEIIRTNNLEINGRDMAVQLVRLGKLDQMRLVFYFIEKKTGFSLEYTATTDTFDFFLEEVWKSVQSIAFIER